MITDAERLRILVELDQLAFARLYPGISAEDILPALHKARYEVTDVPENLRQQSRVWLQLHGFTRFRNLPWDAP